MLLSESEHAQFDLLPAAQQADRLIDCWTRKEALAKALGSGLRQGLDRLSLHPWPGHQAERVECATDTLWVAPLALPRESHVAALASTAPVREVRCGWWDSQQAQ
jgi:phosphopantetheinyl transferase